MDTSRVLLRGVLIVCLWSCSVWPTSAQGVGAIGGTVTDSSGAVLPGATVTLSNAQGGTVGGQQDATTDDRGAYQFLRLVPGTYHVRGQMSGFRTVEQRNIVVNADNTSRADLLLPLGQLEEGVVVSGQAPLLDTTSALRQVSLSQEVLQSLPNRVDVWSITRAIPSITVSKVDVGGSESFQDSVATVRGTSNEGGILIDGMNVSSTTGFGITPAFYPIPWAYAETNFQAGNGPAESSRGGLLYNMISRTGTNQLHGGGAFNGTNHGLFFDNVSPELRTQVLRNVPARVLAANPDLKPGADIRYFFDYGGWIAGPIVPDKVWFSTTFFHQQILQHNLGAYSADGTPVPDDSFIWNNSNKLAWQVMPSSQLSWFHTIQRKVQAHQPSLTQFQEAGATMYNGKTPQVHQLKWTSSLSSKMLFDASGSILRIHDFYEPPPEAPQDALIAGFDQVTNTLLRVLPSFRDANYRRMGFYTSLSYFTASHDIKGGYQFDYGQYLNTNYSTSGMRAVYRNGVPDSVNTYNTPNSFNMKDREVGLYIQDKWRPTRKLTVNIGLRYERNYGWMDAVCQDETPFVQARCYDALKGFPDFQDVNPRFSAIYDVRGDGRTALKFSANRYVVPIGISVVNRVNPNQLTSDTRPWTACAAAQVSGCDLNRDLLPQLNELGPSSGFTFGINNRYAEDYERPHAREYTVEIQRQLPGNVVLTTGYTRREKRGEIGSRNVAVPTSTYIPITVTEVNSGRMVTVYNQAPSLRGQVDLLWDNESLMNSTYNGGDITFDKRMSNKWMLTGGLSVGKTTGWVGNTDLNNPNSEEFGRGIVGNDVPASFRLSGVYDLFYGLTASGTFQHQYGLPELTTVSVGNNTIALTQGTQAIIVEPRGTTRLPRLNQVDISFRKAVRYNGKLLQPRFDVYNLTNADTITSRNTVLGSNYQVVNNIQRGRLVKFGVSLDF